MQCPNCGCEVEAQEPDEDDMPMGDDPNAIAAQPDQPQDPRQARMLQALLNDMPEEE